MAPMPLHTVHPPLTCSWPAPDSTPFSAWHQVDLFDEMNARKARVLTLRSLSMET